MAFKSGVFSNFFGNNAPAGQAQPNQQQQPQGNQGPGGGGGQGNQGGGGGPAQGQQQRPANSQFQVPGSGNGNNQPGTSQNNQNNQQQQQQEPHVLDQYLALLTPSKEVQERNQQNQQKKNAPLFGEMTPEKMQEMVGKTNFTQNLDPAKVQAALGGDTAAFGEVLNSAIQQAFSASLQMTQGMVEHGVNTGSERMSGDLDSRFRDYQLRTKNSNNPALQHPIGQALLGTIKKQIAAANPSLNADQIQTQAEGMFQDFAKTMSPQQDANKSDPNAPKETNWLQFLEDSDS